MQTNPLIAVNMDCMTKRQKINPVLKWVGGKRQLLPRLVELLPQDEFNRYYEPFIGGGALVFQLQPPKAVLNDYNAELINLYRVIRDKPERLIEHLKTYENTEECFYRVRALDRDIEQWDKLQDFERASRMLFLNKTCYNGLYRVNSQGQVNVPFGRYKNPNICPEQDIREMSEYLNGGGIEILQGDYRRAVESANNGNFVYFDPPYDPISQTAAYTGYTSSGFSRENQIELCETCKELDARGVLFMLSNSATEFIRDIYSGFNVSIVPAKRAINCKGDKRGAVDEVIVRNYS